jgi:hypothetical protein
VGSMQSWLDPEHSITRTTERLRSGVLEKGATYGEGEI